MNNNIITKSISYYRNPRNNECIDTSLKIHFNSSSGKEYFVPVLDYLKKDYWDGISADTVLQENGLVRKITNGEYRALIDG